MEDEVWEVRIRREQDVLAAIGKLFLEFAELEQAALARIRGIVRAAKPMFQGIVDGALTEWIGPFDERDMAPGDTIVENVGKIVSLVRAIDTDDIYYPHLSKAHRIFGEMNCVRRCLAHSSSSIDAKDPPSILLTAFVKRSKGGQWVRSADGSYRHEKVVERVEQQFSVGLDEIIQIQTFIRRFGRFLHMCEINVMYKYGWAKDYGNGVFRPMDLGSWPMKFWKSPFPWRDNPQAVAKHNPLHRDL